MAFVMVVMVFVARRLGDGSFGAEGRERLEILRLRYRLRRVVLRRVVRSMSGWRSCFSRGIFLGLLGRVGLLVVHVGVAWSWVEDLWRATIGCILRILRGRDRWVRLEAVVVFLCGHFAGFASTQYLWLEDERGSEEEENEAKVASPSVYNNVAALESRALKYSAIHRTVMLSRHAACPGHAWRRLSRSPG